MTEMERQALEEVRVKLTPLRVYTVERILGMGGAGCVLRVYHRVLKVHYALKLVHDGLLRSRIIRERFNNEARIMHGITDPNVVKVHDLGELPDGSPYIVMDLLEGGTLEDHLNQFGVMPFKQAVQVAVATLRGLQAAHDKGIVHRDIKPQNILFDRDGTPKITDFGIAHVAAGTHVLTRLGSKMGSPGYVSPEQWHGEVSLVDQRTDIHAVGAMLFQMLCPTEMGESPFAEQIAAFPHRLDVLPDPLQEVVRRAVALVPNDRFGTAREMEETLQSILVGLVEDPEGTPALGSAPAVKAQADSASDASDPQIPRVGGTLAPDPTWAQPGHEEALPALSQGTVFEEQLQHPSYTIHPEVDIDAEAAELSAIRQAAKRRFYRRVVLPAAGLLLALVMGVGVWFATRPAPIVETEPVTEPITELITNAEAEPLSMLVVDPVESITPEPTPAAVVRPNPTPRAVVKPLPEASVTVEEKAQIHLILKLDTTATVTLTGDSGTFTLTGGLREVPQGTYRVSIEMPGREAPQTGTLTVTPGLTSITCDSRFMMCTVPK